MRMLEARFHPRDERNPTSSWWAISSGGAPGNESARCSSPPGPLFRARVVSKLQYLIDMTEPGSFERLQSLRGEFRSFVPIQADDRAARSPGSLS